MVPFFRKLSQKDIPQILELVRDIWEWGDYVSNKIYVWFQRTDAHQIGLFLQDAQKKEILIGMAQIRLFPNQVAWMEAGRIAPSYQRQGYGRLLTESCIQYAQELGAERVQYDTWTSRFEMENPTIPQNHGSIALALRYGYVRKTYLDVLISDANQLKFSVHPSSLQMKEIAEQNVLPYFQQILGEIPKEINHGWNFVPAIPEAIHCLSNHVQWWGNGKALIQIMQPSNDCLVEEPKQGDLWFILYGEPHTAFELMRAQLTYRFQLSELHEITIFCAPTISEELFPYGFHYYDSTPTGVALFEKKLIKRIESDC